MEGIFSGVIGVFFDWIMENDDEKMEAIPPAQFDFLDNFSIPFCFQILQSVASFSDFEG